MKGLESPAVAEDKQRRKAEFIPPFWPVVVVLAIIIGLVVWLH